MLFSRKRQLISIKGPEHMLSSFAQSKFAELVPFWILKRTRSEDESKGNLKHVWRGRVFLLLDLDSVNLEITLRLFTAFSPRTFLCID